MNEVFILGVIMILVAILGLVWDFATGLIGSGMDGILLFVVCVVIGIIFGIQILVLLREKFHSRHASPGSGK